MHTNRRTALVVCTLSALLALSACLVELPTHINGTHLEPPQIAARYHLRSRTTNFFRRAKSTPGSRGRMHSS